MDGHPAVLKKIVPTVLLKANGSFLKQLIKITIDSVLGIEKAVLSVKSIYFSEEFILKDIFIGESIHEIYISELPVETDVEFCLKASECSEDTLLVRISPPRHWTVHVVQLSHHDYGYTNLPSNVVEEYDTFIDAMVDMLEETKGLPEDSKMRVVMEQAWSIHHYLKRAPSARAERIIDYVREGRVEVTALFGNMATELCGHEALHRLLYPAYELKRKYGIPIVSAEHNDIPGLSWGLSRILTDAGIKIFCPGLPLYYEWGDLKRQSFWDEKAFFPHGGPGAFWWEAPTGKRLLFWCNNSGCGGDARPDMPGLAEKLGELNRQDYPYSVIRWPVQGASRDNSPYIADYAYAINKWNDQWAYPRLVCSTNALFYNDFIRQVPGNLPVFRGELAGQDYPAGFTSTAAPTALNRNNQNQLISAEKLSSFAVLHANARYPEGYLVKSMEDILFYYEHNLGYQFPCGPAVKASEYEKGVHAYRAGALLHDAVKKASACLSDSITTGQEGIFLVVFNTCPYQNTGPVEVPLREIDNCGTTLHKIADGNEEQGTGHLKSYLFVGRGPVRLSPEIADGRFALVELDEGQSIPYQTVEIRQSDETTPYAAERLGIGSGTKRLGRDEVPLGLKRSILFIAHDVPANGYKTYRVVPQNLSDESGHEKTCGFSDQRKMMGIPAAGSDVLCIENEYYRIEVCKKTGRVKAVIDKEWKSNLLDSQCSHGLGDVIVRDPRSNEEHNMENVHTEISSNGPVLFSIDVTGALYGHPAVRRSFKLYAGQRQIHTDIRILKDSTPLLHTSIAFPFLVKTPQFRYEGGLSVMNPIEDYLPGSYSDIVSVQNWVKITDGNRSILWSSVDAPVASFGGFWPGYVSQACGCIVSKDLDHPPLRKEDLNKGWIYSNILNNNFGTSFSVTQTGDLLFRYAFTTMEGDVADWVAASFGWKTVMPMQSIFTEGKHNGALPSRDSFVETDNDKVVFLGMKKAEDGKGYILRLWNMNEAAEKITVKLKHVKIGCVMAVNPAEEDTGKVFAHDSDAFSVTIESREIASFRMIEGG